MLYTVDYQTLQATPWKPGTEPDKNCAIVSAKSPEEAAEFAARRYKPLEIAKKKVHPILGSERLDPYHKQTVAVRVAANQLVTDATKLSDSLEQMVSITARSSRTNQKRVTVDREKLEECFALADWIATALSDSSA